MHDGYLFTLGICGSASDSGPAPACLDLMLAALPPVKRAAFLGEVLLSTELPSFDDPMIEPIRADIADVELLLIVAPLVGGGLPARLQILARAVEQAPPPARPRFAALLALGTESSSTLTPLQRMCQSANIEIVEELWIAVEGELNNDIRERMADFARNAYAIARREYPDLLPR